MSRISDLALMSIAIDEAQQVASRDVYPNPRVGAAIICENGEELSSFHALAGSDHAELRLLKLCKTNNLSTEGATLAVTLEPCCHHGKTPPCTDAIIAAKIKRVLIAGVDPFEKVSGEGIKKLEAAGIEVALGIMSVEAEKLNREWLWAHRNKRPFVTLKIASSIDGRWKTAKGEDRWVTSEAARADAHVLRSQVQAIISSSQTITDDNPKMTARMSGDKLFVNQPIPIVFTRDKNFSIPLDSNLMNHPLKTRITDSSSLSHALEDLYKNDIFHVLVESGPFLSQEFIKQNLANEIVLYIETNFFGESAFGFKTPFNNGLLPGQRCSIAELSQLSKTSLKIVLHPDRQ